MNVKHAEFSMDGVLRLKGVKLTGAKINQRTPTHTIVLLDTSGSMNENNKLNNVKRSLLYLVKYLQPTDILSLVTFNTRSTVKINARMTQENLEMFQYMITNLSADGGTNLSAGLFNVKEIIESSDTPQLKAGLIILTDGHTNEGITHSSNIIDIINDLKHVQPNLSIATIAYGDDHNVELLRDIGLLGGGSYNVVNDQDTVAVTFGEIFGGLISCVVQNIVLEYPSSWRCLNMFPSATRGDTTYLEIGDLYSESELTILFKQSDSREVVLKGVNAQNYKRFVIPVQWSSITTESMESYKVSYIQARVAACLVSTAPHAYIRSECLELSRYLQDPTLQYHPLVKVLQNEVQHIINDEINDLERTQHSAYFTTGRGISRTVCIDTNVLAGQLTNLNISSPFSNRVQRDLTQSIQLDNDPV